MPRIKSILTFAAISAATAASATGIAGALPTAGYGLPWAEHPKARPDRSRARRGSHERAVVRSGSYTCAPSPRPRRLRSPRTEIRRGWPARPAPATPVPTQHVTIELIGHETAVTQLISANRDRARATRSSTRERSFTPATI
jgi:hypothetical protein